MIAVVLTLALASAMLISSPALAEEPATPPDPQIVEESGAEAVPEPTDLSAPMVGGDQLATDAEPQPTLPPVTWPAHGTDPSLIHLTGAIFSQSADGTTAAWSNQVHLKAKDAPWATIASASGTTFAFYNLTPGREYYLELPYGDQVVFSGVTPFLSEARTYTETTYEIPVVLPKPAEVSGSISAIGTTTDNQIGMVVDALRFNERTGQFEKAGRTSTYTRSYQITGLYPGTYVFRGSQALSDNRFSDEFHPDGDHFEDAVPIEVHSEEVLIDIDFLLPEAVWTTYRLAGASRYATSVEVSKETYDPGVPVLYITSGSNWPDALSAGPAASKLGGALLLTDPSVLLEVTRAEIERLAPARVVVVGGLPSVSDAVYRRIEAMVPEISRIGGVDRYDTSRKLVEDAFGPGPYETVFLATGTNFPDALSAGPIAGRLGQPVLLVNGSSAGLDAPTRDALVRLDPSEITVLGGTPSISSGVEAALRTEALADSVRRIAGPDRYETNSWLNNAYGPNPYVGLVFLANGGDFPDALAGAASAAAYGAAVVLTPNSCLTWSAYATIGYWDWDRIVLLGGEPSLSAEVANLEICP